MKKKKENFYDPNFRSDFIVKRSETGKLYKIYTKSDLEKYKNRRPKCI